MLLMVLMLAGCPIPETGTGSELQAGDQEEARAVQAFISVKQVACGLEFSMVLKTDGTLWATGYNMYGQLGFGSTVDETGYTKADGGYSFSAIAGTGSFLHL